MNVNEALLRREDGGRSYDIHFSTRGEGEESLIFHHGYNSSGRYFETLLQHLDASRYRFVLIDCRGCGKSSKEDLAPENHSLLGYAEDVIAVADHLGMKVFTFAGFSMGGAVGKLLAIDYPQRLARLVLLSPTPCNRALGRIFTPEFNKIMRTMKMSGDKEKLISGWMSTLSPGRTVSREVAEHFIDDWLASSFGHFDGMYTALTTFELEDTLLSSIHIPTLVMEGADSPCLKETLREFALLPVATLHVFCRASHDFILELPSQVAEVLEGFLQYGIPSKVLVPNQ